MMEKTKESAQKKIVEVFSNIKTLKDWKYELHKFLRSNMSWKSKPFFVENALRLPTWLDYHTFSEAVAEIIRLEPTWQESQWFNNLCDEIKPRPKIKECIRCGEKVFSIVSPRTGNEIVLELKPIEKNQDNSDIFVFTNAKEMKKVKELEGEEKGYIAHKPICPNADYYQPSKEKSQKIS